MTRVKGAQSPVRPAIRWFLRIRDEEMPAPDTQELREWEQFASDPAHRQELAQAKALWEAARALGGPQRPTDAELEADDFDGSRSVREWLTVRSLQRPARQDRYMRSSRALLLAASFALLVLGAAIYVRPWSNRESQGPVQAFVTPVAQQRVITLIDGSRVTLGAGSEIRTRIGAVERIIVLDRGEAWFAVAHDEQRPFRVFAGDGVITALGTEFNVRRDRGADLDRVTVTVGTGVVKVEPRSRVDESAPLRLVRVIAGRESWQPARLVKGQELSYEYTNGRGEVRHADIEAAAAWQEGRLEYIHQPLKTVVARVNRYTPKPIVLADDAVGEIDFSGTVFEGQIDEWIRAMETAFPIEVTETNTEILIRSKERISPQ